MYHKVLLFHPVYFGERGRWNFGKVAVILSVISSVSCSAERSFSVFRRPKTNNGAVSPQSSVLNMLMSIELILNELGN